EIRDMTSRMDRLTDSVTVGLLRELNRTRPIAAFRHASLGARSLPALSTFLRGEQFFRRAAWDSAMTHYRRAVTLDSAFTIAWSGLGDARMHWPLVGRTTPGQILEAFDRAIALDSAFGPAYIHPVEVALQLGRPAAARRYLAAYLALDRADMNSEGMGLVERL